MQQYEIVLKNEKIKTYALISWLILFANFISLILLTIAFDFKMLVPLFLACIALITVFFLNYLKPKGQKLSFYVPFFICSLAWFLAGYWWLGIINLVFTILEPAAKKKLSVWFLSDKIIYPSLFQKNIPWNEITNTMLKDGILTIDFKNNKIIQQLIDESSSSVNEQEFNDFCNRQLKSTNITV